MTEGQIIKAAREKAGHTQASLGAKLGFSSAQFVSNFERNISKAPKTSLKKMARLLGMRPVKEIVELRAKEYRKELMSELD